MTAEVSVMNKKGVALAADSAVTGRLAGDPKTFDSTNKLFRLSDSHSVGVMVFGNANFMNIPWETIIKMYGQHISGNDAATVEEHMDIFIRYLENNNDLFPESLQKKIYISKLYRLLSSIVSNVGGSTANKSDIIEKINDQIQECEGRDDIDNIDEDYLDYVKDTYNDIVEDDHIKNIIDIDKMDDNLREKIKRLAFLFASKKALSNKSSGIVFAGYGGKQHFPAIISVNIEMILNDVAKYKIGRNHEISHGMEAGVFSFAQDDMLQTFMEGVHPTYNNAIRGYIKGALDDIPDWISSEMKKENIQSDKIDRLESRIKSVIDDFSDEFGKDMEDFRKENYSDPIINTIKILPKGELANVAESLVNITSFKRKYSSANETVGGPIDVAVISKGDGFVWMEKDSYLD